MVDLALRDALLALAVSSAVASACSGDILVVSAPESDGARAAWVVTSVAGEERARAFDLDAARLVLSQPLAGVEAVTIHYFAESASELGVSAGPIELVTRGRPVPPPRASYRAEVADADFAGWQRVPTDTWSSHLPLEAGCPALDLEPLDDELGREGYAAVVGAFGAELLLARQDVRAGGAYLAPIAISATRVRALDRALAQVAAVGERGDRALAIDVFGGVRWGRDLDTLTASVAVGWPRGYRTYAATFGAAGDPVDLWAVATSTAERRMRYVELRAGRFRVLGEVPFTSESHTCATLGLGRAMCITRNDFASPAALGASGIESFPVPQSLRKLGEDAIGSLVMHAELGAVLGGGRGQLFSFDGRAWRSLVDTSFGDVIRSVVELDDKLLVSSRGDVAAVEPATGLTCAPLATGLDSCSLHPLSRDAWLVVGSVHAVPATTLQILRAPR